MINSVELINFKCYKKYEFVFSNLTVFCGNNSAGKSTSIQSILLAFQNNFSSNIKLSGDYIQPGSYYDIHNRDAEEDSLIISIGTNVGNISWGYEEIDFDSEKRKFVQEAALPLVPADSNVNVQSALRKSYENNFSYLTAERLGPRSNYPYSTQRRSRYWMGIHGEFAPQVLNDVVESTVSLPEKDARCHAKSNSHTVADNLYEWMGEISPGVFIKAESHKDADIATSQYQFGEHTFRAVNVGFGLSYSLPVVLALLLALPGSLVIIENPEAHLHPRGQSYLGRLIALTAQAGVQVIIETHSDHVLNGIRLMPRLNLVDSSKIKIYQVNNEQKEVKVQPITVDNQGQLSEWPELFFDQQLIDMDILMSGEE